MNKIFDFFIKKFYNSKLGSLYLTHKIEKDFKKFREGVGKKYLPNEIIYNRVQAQYEEGIKKIKNKVNNSLVNRTKEEYDKNLKTYGEEVLDLSKNETKEEIEALKKAYIFSGADIKSESDKEHMIQKRIRDFMELRKNRELRKKVREDRRNRNNG